MSEPSGSKSLMRPLVWSFGPGVDPNPLGVEAVLEVNRKYAAGLVVLVDRIHELLAERVGPLAPQGVGNADFILINLRGSGLQFGGKFLFLLDRRVVDIAYALIPPPLRCLLSSTVWLLRSRKFLAKFGRRGREVPRFRHCLFHRR